MSKDIKVQLEFHGQSTGRGIGVYESNLLENLKDLKGIDIVTDKADIIHYTFFDLFWPTLKLNKKSKNIVTVHDITPLVLSSRYPKGIKGSINFLRQWFQLKKASAIITDSHCSKKDIVKVLRIPESKVFVTHLAVNNVYRKTVTDQEKAKVIKKYNLPEKFLLTVAAGPNPNKNLPNLAEATERVGIPLVIVGWGINQEIIKPVNPELIDLVRLEVYQHLIRLDDVSNDDLFVLQKLASAYIQGSLYEGFGIPVLEAMTVGCPVISSRSSSLPEVYHPDTITFNPKNINSIEKAIKKFFKLSPKSKELYIEKNKQKAKEFSWEKTAKKTLEVYKHVYAKQN